jgi:nucleoside-diphosphate-sugar epimerase
MRLLITGGAGYVGSELIYQLISRFNYGYFGEKNLEIDVIDNNYRNTVKYSQQFLHYSNYHFYLDTIANRCLLDDLISKTDVVIHLAALVGYDICNNNPDLTILTNEIGTKVISEMCQKYNKRLIFASTECVYGKNTDEIYTEDTPLNSQTIYGKSKIRGEQYVKECKNYTIFRFGAACGLGRFLRYDLMLTNLTQLCKKSGFIDIYQPNVTRHLINVKDMCTLIMDALRSNDNDIFINQIYNVFTIQRTKRDIVQLITSKIPCQINYIDNKIDPENRNYQLSTRFPSNYNPFVGIGLSDSIDETIKALEMSCEL